MLSLIVFLGGCLFLLCASLLYFHAQHVLHRLDNILDSAISGTFQPSCYDESQISRTEQKFSQFLSASILSRKALDTDRARIQALIGDIAHQSRTPIANILLYTGLLAEEALTDEQRVLVEQAITQTEKLGFLIDSLVKTSRLESGMVQVSPYTVHFPICCVIWKIASPLRRSEITLISQWSFRIFTPPSTPNGLRKPLGI